MTLKELQTKANEIREDIIKMLLEAGSGHSAGPLGMADVFTALYFEILNQKPEDPFWIERDRLFLSNGHICPVRYTAMAHAGYFPKSELMTLRKLGSRLQGHPERERLPGVETTSGPVWLKPQDTPTHRGWMGKSSEFIVSVATVSTTRATTGKQ